MSERARHFLALSPGGDEAELLPRRGYEVRYRPEADSIGFAFESQSGLHAFASDRPTPYRSRPNSLAFLPAGCDVFSRSQEGGEYLILRCAAPVGATRRFNDHIDEKVIAAAYALRNMILRGGPPAPLQFEAAVQALRESARRARQAALASPARWMTPRRLKLIDEMITARLAEPLTVGDLAGELQLSPGFLSRSVRAAVGMPPHRYILERRLSQARLMIETSAAPLADIAFACGFASHAHLSASLRRYFGLSPRDLRRQDRDDSSRHHGLAKHMREPAPAPAGSSLRSSERNVSEKNHSALAT